MTQKLSPKEAEDYRLAGLESMLRTLAAYRACGEVARVLIYPDGGWAIENPNQVKNV